MARVPDTYARVGEVGFLKATMYRADRIRRTSVRIVEDALHEMAD